jgi:hypothetical protein
MQHFLGVCIALNQSWRKKYETELNETSNMPILNRFGGA